MLRRAEQSDAAFITSHGVTASVSIPEETTAIASLTAVGTPTPAYSKTGDDAALVTLTDNADGTATVAFTVAPDFGDPQDANADNVYVFTVTASNVHGSESVEFSVTVTDTTVAPTITSHTDPDTESIAENTRTVTTIECDGSESPVYSITGGADEDFFEIHAVTGLLQFKLAPDYEDPQDADTNNTYVVTVTATNDAGSDSVTITVTVTDVETESSEPALPQAEVDPTLPEGWDGTPDATPTNASELQAALNNANQNGSDPYIIRLDADVTYKGTFKVLNKTGSQPVIIISDEINDLPVAGERVNLTYADHMPTIQSPDGSNSAALWCEYGAHDIYFVGVRFASDWHSTAANQTTLIYLGYQVGANANPSSHEQSPDMWVFDRCIIQGTEDGSLTKGIQSQANSLAVVDSYFCDIHTANASDSNTVWIGNCVGPVLLRNNYLSAAGEVILMGGTATPVTGAIPSDITVANNHMHKPLTWNNHHPDYAGRNWTEKNIFEIKNGKRVLLEGNVLENTWSDSQVGYGIVLTPRGYGGTTWGTCEDVTIRYNLVKNVNHGIQMASTDYNAESDTLKRVKIENNLIIINRDIGGVNGGRRIHCGPQFDAIAGEVIIRNNTFAMEGSQPPNNALMAGSNLIFGTSLIFENNIMELGGGISAPAGKGTVALNTLFHAWTCTNNVFIKNGVAVNEATYPAGNHFPATTALVGYEDAGAGLYELVEGPYLTAGTDGGPIGCDIPALNAAIAGVVQE